jgi:hypothetical protein
MPFSDIRAIEVELWLKNLDRAPAVLAVLALALAFSHNSR